MWSKIYFSAKMADELNSFLPVIEENARLKNILYSTIAIPSFSKDSPSMIVDNCLLVPLKRSKSVSS